MYMCSLVSAFCSHHFSVKQLSFEIYIKLCQYFFQFLFRGLNIKLNLVKLTFWTAISSHQVVGMSLTKGWVNTCIKTTIKVCFFRKEKLI